LSTFACYIVNYNARDYTVNCILSVLESDFISNNNIPVILVDNASSDDSISVAIENFGDRIKIICNKENKGGAGGFNTALNDAIERKIDYAILLDNDIRVDKDCIENMVSYLDENSGVGAVGAMIMQMDKPNHIQEFGGHLDMERYYFKTDYWYEEDSVTEDVIESDWLTSCALAVRMDAAKMTHLFPEENFLYWDDIQFTWEIKEAGYKLISLTSAKVWHKGKKKAITNTTSAYYAMRNRTKFFSICEKEDRLDFFCRRILEEYFNIFFGSTLKGLDKVNSCRMMALDDFIHKRYGKIRDEIVWSIENDTTDLKKICGDRKMACIVRRNGADGAYDEITSVLSERLLSVGVSITEHEEDADIVFMPCEDVKNVTKDILPSVWIDKYLNCVSSEDDYKRVQAMPYIKEMFIKTHYEWLKWGIIEERKRYLSNRVTPPNSQPSTPEPY